MRLVRFVINISKKYAETQLWVTKAVKQQKSTGPQLHNANNIVI